MSYLIKPKNYKPLLDLKQTELGIKQIKEFFQLNLSSELRLRRVTAPLFVLKGMGINDDLNGIERPVSFPIKDLGDAQAEVVHSLAKWKRLTLADYHIEPGYGIYTDMNAIRSDEELGNLHSLYVDQWDWERVITDEDRNVNFLKEIVNRIYAAMIRTEYMVYEMYPQIKPCLPQKLHFIHSEELRQLYPNLEPKCREHAICQKYGAVFIIGIGCKLSDGKKHDGRAPDYDDYTTNGLNGLPGLNGDLLLWDDVLQRSIELSSMGIRVDKEALQRQLKEEHEEKRLELYFHKRLMNDTLPLSIGGGIGQSRLCMFYLRKAHIGEIQAKWKRLTLADYHIEPGYGIYTDMNAIRSDEELGNLHSLYVDQWDWERVITDEDRNVNFLKEIVNRIYAAMIRTEYMVYEMYPQIKPCLPQKLHFIHSEELRQLYPNLEPKCREHAICQKYGAVFIIGIGCKLSDGKKHDGRAPDYDDYTTNGLNGLPGLNGDLLLWDDVLQRSIELSSMGIRVDKEALQRQLKEEHEEKRLELYFHKRLMNDTLPLSIGGGIGQSRLCMFYLRKAHIGEIQASIWPEDMRKECEELDIHLI